ncbi:MAG: MBL fold metallo-hydrolase RNA specificity domain-containing protein [Anaerolineae bacterium]
MESTYGDRLHLAWARPLDRNRLARVFLVHGEPGAAATLADRLGAEGVKDVYVPVRGESVEF